MSIKLVSRCDDFGSARAANRAILEGAACGYYVRNVSCMAVGPYIEEGAESLKRYKNIDIGLHVTLNSEWEEIKWGPVSQCEKEAGMTDENGYFFPSQKELAEHCPDFEAVIREYDAQLDRLTQLGLHVVYADSHMFPELFIDGLEEEFAKWADRKGLLNAIDYHNTGCPMSPPFAEEEEVYLAQVEKWLKDMPDGGQYFCAVHPAVKSEEMLRMWNQQLPKGLIQRERNMEYRLITSKKWEDWIERLQICPVRYTEAEKQENGADALRIMVHLK